MTKQICECHPDCNPNDYEGRTMVLTDEGWHNWFFNSRIEQDCPSLLAHDAYNCATCNVFVCDSCDHIHRDYWSGERQK